MQVGGGHAGAADLRRHRETGVTDTVAPRKPRVVATAQWRIGASHVSRVCLVAVEKPRQLTNDVFTSVPQGDDHCETVESQRNRGDGS
jgi:hypothetical protein